MLSGMPVILSVGCMGRGNAITNRSSGRSLAHAMMLPFRKLVMPALGAANGLPSIRIVIYRELFYFNLKNRS